MDHISKAIQEMNQIDFPPGLHGKIMRRLLFLRFRTPFLIISGLLVLNLIMSGWRLWEKLSEAEAGAVLSALWGVAGWEWSAMWGFVTEAITVIPVTSVLVVTVNLLALGYVLRLPQLFAKYQQPVLIPNQ